MNNLPFMSAIGLIVLLSVFGYGSANNSTCDGQWSALSSTCYIRANCSEEGLVITIKGVDFPNDSPLSVAWLQTVSNNGAYDDNCSIFVNETDTEYEQLFAPNSSCIIDTSDAGNILNGTMTTYLYLRYLGENIQSTQDFKAAISCIFTSPDQSTFTLNTGLVNANFELSNGTVESETGSIPWNDTKMTFYKDAGSGLQALPTVTKNGKAIPSFDVKASTGNIKICGKIVTGDIYIPDFQINELTVKNAENSATNTINVITAGCPVADFESIFTYPAMSTQADEACTTSTAVENCRRQRLFCFVPFRFVGEDTLYIDVTLFKLTNDTTPTPGNDKDCSSARRRRSIEEEIEEEIVAFTGVLNVGFGEDEPFTDAVSEDCERITKNKVQAYMITCVVLGGAIILLATALTYLAVIINRTPKFPAV